MLQSLAPVIFVNAIEPCLDFWESRLGFARTAEVPEGDRLGFVMLVKDEVTVMLQTVLSAKSDSLQHFDGKTDSYLFITCDGIDPMIASMGEVEVILPRRETFYGADEIAVRPHEGCVVCFAHFKDRAAG